MRNFERDQSGAVLSDVIKFERQMKKYQITIYDDNNFHKLPVYSSRRKKQQINIFFSTEHKHFIALSNVKGFFGVAYHCRYCGHLRREQHRCGKVSDLLHSNESNLMFFPFLRYAIHASSIQDVGLITLLRIKRSFHSNAATVFATSGMNYVFRIIKSGVCRLEQIEIR